MNTKLLYWTLPLWFVAMLADAQSGAPFRDPLRDGGEGPEMVIIPAGQFLMGSPPDEVGRDAREGPQHRVSIDRFAIGRTEVTFDDYDRFARATGRAPPGDRGWGRGSRPVINVGWSQARDYARWLSEQTGQQYRLPSEAEWEYAARAGTTTPFSTGHCISATQANFNVLRENAYANCPVSGVYLRVTQPVASYPPNAFGLHDMHGNVGEWVRDCWHETYDGAPPDGSAWLEPDPECGPVVRGETWASYPRGLRSAFRFGSTKGVGGQPSSFNGFRVARSF
jgi:formylglycine-generating enzyme required for sulfatase activity